MQQVTLIEKRIRLSAEKAMKYQIITWCFLNDLSISKTDMDILIMVMNSKESDLKSLCTNQSVRNSLNKLAKLGIIQKTKKYNKTVKINPQISMLDNPPYIINYKIGVNEAKEG